MTDTAIREFCVALVLRGAVGLGSLSIACSSGTSSLEEPSSETQSPSSVSPQGTGSVPAPEGLENPTSVDPGPSPLVDAGGPDSGRSCDTRDLLCRRAEPPCPEGQVPEIVNNCYGECVRIDRCECDAPEACPQPNEFTCIQSTGRCSYYLR